MVLSSRQIATMPNPPKSTISTTGAPKEIDFYWHQPKESTRRLYSDRVNNATTLTELYGIEQARATYSSGASPLGQFVRELRGFDEFLEDGPINTTKFLLYTARDGKKLISSKRENPDRDIEHTLDKFGLIVNEDMVMMSPDLLCWMPKWLNSLGCLPFLCPRKQSIRPKELQDITLWTYKKNSMGRKPSLKALCKALLTRWAWTTHCCVGLTMSRSRWKILCGGMGVRLIKHFAKTP